MNGESDVTLTIHDPDAYRLARELAEIRGQSVDDVVLDALRKERARVAHAWQRKADTSELLAIGHRCAEHLVRPTGAVDHGALLYDDTGLPA